MLSNARVTLDGLVTVTAYAVEEEAWNGFAAPYFTREQADDLAAQLAANGDSRDDDTIRYEPVCPVELDGPHVGDGYVHHSPQADENECCGWTPGRQLPGETGGPTVYLIGAYGWIWTILE